jgi:hypothetical protein
MLKYFKRPKLVPALLAVLVMIIMSTGAFVGAVQENLNDEDMVMPENTTVIMDEAGETDERSIIEENDNKNLIQIEDNFDLNVDMVDPALVLDDDYVVELPNVDRIEIEDSNVDNKKYTYTSPEGEVIYVDDTEKIPDLDNSVVGSEEYLTTTTNYNSFSDAMDYITDSQSESVVVSEEVPQGTRASSDTIILGTDNPDQAGTGMGYLYRYRTSYTVYDGYYMNSYEYSNYREYRGFAVYDLTDLTDYSGATVTSGAIWIRNYNRYRATGIDFFALKTTPKEGVSSTVAKTLHEEAGGTGTTKIASFSTTTTSDSTYKDVYLPLTSGGITEINNKLLSSTMTFALGSDIVKATTSTSSRYWYMYDVRLMLNFSSTSKPTTSNELAFGDELSGYVYRTSTKYDFGRVYTSGTTYRAFAVWDTSAIKDIIPLKGLDNKDVVLEKIALRINSPYGYLQYLSVYEMTNNPITGSASSIYSDAASGNRYVYHSSGGYVSSPQEFEWDLGPDALSKFNDTFDDDLPDFFALGFSRSSSYSYMYSPKLVVYYKLSEPPAKTIVFGADNPVRSGDAMGYMYHSGSTYYNSYANYYSYFRIASSYEYRGFSVYDLAQLNQWSGVKVTEGYLLARNYRRYNIYDVDFFAMKSTPYDGASSSNDKKFFDEAGGTGTTKIATFSSSTPSDSTYKDVTVPLSSAGITEINNLIGSSPSSWSFPIGGKVTKTPSTTSSRYMYWRDVRLVLKFTFSSEPSQPTSSTPGIAFGDELSGSIYKPYNNYYDYPDGRLYARYSSNYPYRGYAQWDVSDIKEGLPENVIIKKVKLVVNNAYGSGRINIHHMKTDVTSTGASAIFTDCGDGTKYASSVSISGYDIEKEVDLGTTAVADFINAFEDDNPAFFGLGFVATSSYSYMYAPKLIIEWRYEPPQVKAHPGGPYVADEGVAIMFNANLSRNLTKGTGHLKYSWDWDYDGNFDDVTTSPYINHTWDDDHTGLVTLLVNDTDSGAWAMENVTVDILNVPPRYKPNTGEVSPAVLFEANSATFKDFEFTDPGSDTFNYFWDFNADGEFDASGVISSGRKVPTEIWYYDDDFIGDAILVIVDDDGGSTNVSYSKQAKVSPKSGQTGYVRSTYKYISNYLYMYWQYSYVYRRGWARFDLNMIPENADISKVEFDARIVYNRSTNRGAIRELTTDPVSAGASTIFSEAGAGTRITNLNIGSFYGTTGGRKNLGAPGVKLIEDSLSQGWVGLGFDYEAPKDNTYHYAYFYGYSTYPMTLKIDYEVTEPGILVPVLVKNVPPEINPANLTLNPSVVNEGENISLSGLSFYDPGNDSYEYNVVIGETFETGWIPLGGPGLGAPVSIFTNPSFESGSTGWKYTEKFTYDYYYGSVDSGWSTDGSSSYHLYVRPNSVTRRDDYCQIEQKVDLTSAATIMFDVKTGELYELYNFGNPSYGDRYSYDFIAEVLIDNTRVWATSTEFTTFTDIKIDVSSYTGSHDFKFRMYERNNGTNIFGKQFDIWIDNIMAFVPSTHEGWGAYGPGYHNINFSINATIPDDHPLSGTSWDDVTITLYVRDDDDNILIPGTGIGALASPVTIEERAYYSYTGYNGRKLVMDDELNIYAIYINYGSSPYMVYLAKSSDYGQTWSKNKVSSASYFTSTQYYPTLAIDSTGTLHAVWRSYSSGKSGYHIRYANSNDGGATWSNNYNVTTYTGYGRNYNPSIAVDNNDKVHISWYGYSGSSSPYRIFYTNRSASGTWGSVFQVSDTIYSYTPDITTDSKNNVHIVWRGYLSSSVTRYNIKHRMLTASTGTWSSINDVTSDTSSSTYHYYPSIAVDGSDNVHAVWYGRDSSYTRSYAIMYSMFDSSTKSWSSKEYISATNTYYTYQSMPSIAVNSAGEIDVLWYGYTFNDPSWSSPYVLHHAEKVGTSWDLNLNYILTSSTPYYPNLMSSTNSLANKGFAFTFNEGTYPMKLMTSSDFVYGNPEFTKGLDWANKTVRVNNVDPEIVLNYTWPKSVDEQEVFTFHSEFTDPAAGVSTENFEFNITWGNGEYTGWSPVTQFKEGRPGGETSMLIQPNAADGKDAMVRTGGPTTNYGTYTYLMANYGPSTPTSALIEFDLSEIPVGVKVKKATISLYHYYNTNSEWLELREIKGPWSESTVTYNTLPSISSTQVAHAQCQTAYEWLDFVVTDLVQEWVNRTKANYGVYLDHESNYCNSYILSSDSGQSEFHPKLLIEFEEPLPPLLPRGVIEVNYMYPDDHPVTGTPWDSFDITIDVRDDDLGTDSAETDIIVKNVPPEVIMGEITPEDLDVIGIDEGTLVTLRNFEFDDVAYDEPTEINFQYQVDWGDGTATPWMDNFDFAGDTGFGGGPGGPDLYLETTFAANNGQNGNMFDVTAKQTITITSFDLHLRGTFSTNAEVYYKKGTYVGFETNSAAWTQLGSTTPVTGMGTGNPTPCAIGGLTIKRGETYGLYVTLTSSSVGYTNGANLYSNDHLSLQTGVGKSYPFGSTFRPRTWNGRLHYSVGGGGGGSFVYGAETGSSVYIPTPDKIKDARVYSSTSYRNYNYGLYSYLNYYSSSSTIEYNRGYIEFDIDDFKSFVSTNVPAEATIDSIEMSLYQAYGYSGSTYGHNAREVTSSWIEGTKTGSTASTGEITWNNQPTAASTIIASATSQTGSWRAFDITDIMNDWMDSTKTNNGLQLRGYGWYLSPGAFRSSDYSGTTYDPRLNVNWHIDGKPMAEDVNCLATSFNNGRKLVMDSNNNIYGSYMDGTNPSQIIVANSSDMGETFMPTLMTSDAASIGKNQTHPSLTIDSNDVLHVVWSGDIDGTNNIRYANSADGGVSWSNFATITSGSGSSDFYDMPSITIDTVDTVHIVWQGFNAIDTANNIYYASRNALGTWSSTTMLTAGSSLENNFPSVAVDSDGDVHAIWSGQTASSTEFNIQYRMFDSATSVWGTTTVLAADTSNSQFNPSMAVDLDDNLHVAWYTEPAPFMVKYIKRDSTTSTWGSVETVTSNISHNNYNPSLGVDHRGHPYIVWYAKDVVVDPSHGPYRILMSMRDYAGWFGELAVTNPSNENFNSTVIHPSVMQSGQLNLPAHGIALVFTAKNMTGSCNLYFGVSIDFDLEDFGPWKTLPRLVHLYTDDNPTNTERDEYTLTIRMRDDDMSVGEWTLPFEIRNVIPVILSDISSVAGNESSVMLPAVEFSDPGSGSTETWHFWWDLDDDGTKNSCDITGTVSDVTVINGVSYGRLPEVVATYNDDYTGRANLFIYDDDTPSNWQFKAPIYEPGFRILDAQFEAYMFSNVWDEIDWEGIGYTNGPKTYALDMSVYQNLKPWNEYTVNWTNYGGVSTSNMNYIPEDTLNLTERKALGIGGAYPSGGRAHWEAFDITDLTFDWLEGNANNNGISIMPTMLNNTPVNWEHTVYYSSGWPQYVSSTYKPKLTIDVDEDNDGLSDTVYVLQPSDGKDAWIAQCALNTSITRRDGNDTYLLSNLYDSGIGYSSIGSFYRRGMIEFDLSSISWRAANTVIWENPSFNITVDVTANNENPQLLDRMPRFFIPGDLVEFDVIISDAGSDDINFTYDFGDGTPPIDGGQHYNNGVSPDVMPSAFNGTAPFQVKPTLSHIYYKPGTYNVNFSIYDDDGGHTNATIEIKIWSPQELKEEAIKKLEPLVPGRWDYIGYESLTLQADNDPEGVFKGGNKTILAYNYIAKPPFSWEMELFFTFCDVDPGETIFVDGSVLDEGKFGTKLILKTYDNGVLLDETEIPTAYSCINPLLDGQKYGPWEIQDYVRKNGTTYHHYTNFALGVEDAIDSILFSLNRDPRRGYGWWHAQWVWYCGYWMQRQLWVNDSFLDPEYGSIVFNEERKAVESLMEVINNVLKADGVHNMTFRWDGKQTVDIEVFTYGIWWQWFDKWEHTDTFKGIKPGEEFFIGSRGFPLCGKLGKRTLIKVHRNSTGELLDAQYIRTSGFWPLEVEPGNLYGNLFIVDSTLKMDCGEFWNWLGFHDDWKYSKWSWRPWYGDANQMDILDWGVSRGDCGWAIEDCWDNDTAAEEEARIATNLSVLKSAIKLLVMADKVIARLQFWAAENLTAINDSNMDEYEYHLKMAKRYMLRANREAGKGRPHRAIRDYKLSWKNSVLAIKWVLKNQADMNGTEDPGAEQTMPDFDTDDCGTRGPWWMFWYQMNQFRYRLQFGHFPNWQDYVD